MERGQRHAVSCARSSCAFLCHRSGMEEALRVSDVLSSDGAELIAQSSFEMQVFGRSKLLPEFKACSVSFAAAAVISR